jgi:uncharacterized membrane protein YkvA (DUF1232 family)
MLKLKRLAALWTLVRGDARVAWHALRHPGTPVWFKLGLAGVLVYLVSPVDLVPDVLPVLGVVDDLVMVPLVVGFLIRQLPPTVREAARRRAGLSPDGVPWVDEVR